MRVVDRERINPEALAAADAAMLERTKGNRSRPTGLDDELRDFWLDTYERHGGITISVEPKGVAPSAIKVECSAMAEPLLLADPEKAEEETLPPLTLTIVELTFLTDHGLLLDNCTDWNNTGTLYSKPDWTPSKSNIISHSIDELVQVKLVVRARGRGVETGHIQPRVGVACPFAAQPITLTAGADTEVSFTSKRAFCTELSIAMCKFEWFVKTDRRDTSSIGTTENRVLFTFSRPVSRPSEPDDGVTVKRMVTAIRAIKATTKTDPQEIVGALMAKFPRYTLTRNTDVPEEFGHPQYTSPTAGAWPMTDYTAQTAECQAICRFVRGLLDQVGCPGTVAPVVVWCDPETLQAKEAPYGESGSGLRFTIKKVPQDIEVEEREEVTEELGLFDRMRGKTPVTRIETRRRIKHIEERWTARLTTSMATVGSDAEGSGLNLYEACLKFTHGGVTRYYGGGAGSFTSKERVVEAFHSLIWICMQENPRDPTGPLLSVCRRVVHTW